MCLQEYKDLWLGLCSDHFSGWQSLPGVLTKDPTVWLNGARPQNISSKKSKIENKYVIYESKK